MIDQWQLSGDLPSQRDPVSQTPMLSQTVCPFPLCWGTEHRLVIRVEFPGRGLGEALSQSSLSGLCDPSALPAGSVTPASQLTSSGSGCA